MEWPKHFSFTNQPTPIQKLDRVSAKYMPYEVYLKRDDFTGIELTGNKVRKLDFLMADARLQGAERVITCGGIQSNHCRATAFYAQKLGLNTTLVLKGTQPEQPTGNFLLNQLLGVDIKIISQEEYQHVDELMYELAESYAEPCYVIPEGGSNYVGAWGYAKAFDEIMQQMPDVETIVVATGSGGTHAGLLLGKLLFGRQVNIISVNVCEDAAFFKNKIAGILNDVKIRYNLGFSISEDDVHIIDGYVGKGYGQIGDRETETIKRMARSEGFVLDPVYGVKAWLGFEDALKNNSLPGEKVIFIHTGGIFGLFPFADRF